MTEQDSIELGIYGVTNTGDSLVLASQAQAAIFAAVAIKDKRIVELKALCKEASDYLDTNNLTNIGHGSILHTKFKEQGE